MELSVEVSTAGEHSAKETGPLKGHLRVHAVEQEDQNALRGCHDVEDDEEEKSRSFAGDQNFDVTEDPRQTQRDENGDVDSELLLAIPLVRLRSSGEGFCDFSSDEEEKDGVDRNGDKTRDEDGSVVDPWVCDVAHCAGVSIVLKRSHNHNDDSRESPAHKVIPLLQLLSLTISLHDHLIEVVGNSRGPCKVGQQEVVGEESDNDAKRFGVSHPALVGDIHTSVPNRNTYTKVANELDGVCSNLLEDKEGETGEGAAQNGGHEGVDCNLRNHLTDFIDGVLPTARRHCLCLSGRLVSRGNI